MNQKPEVLSPVGSPESLTAAVRAGADAVYLGASRFSARAGAKNFDPDELRKAVEYCHIRGVKVYLAVNTVLTDAELPDALELVKFACTLPVDAILVQDMGLARELFRCAPELRLYASTQTGVHTAAGANALRDAGFCRVVLARELSLRETAEIHRQCPIELESFVHGALCMSVSGQCYFSSVLGSRSGNRGMCAQPCRLPFSSPGGTGHDLSLRDLSLIGRTGEMTDAGVISLKIEGRLKRPEYVAAATRACRLAVDGKSVPPELQESLRAVFSRSGFTQGYADGKRGREMFGVRSKEDVSGATGKVLRSLRGIYASDMRRIPVDFTLEILYHKPVVLTASDDSGHTVQVSGCVPDAAVSRPLDAARCEAQLRRTGGTPFSVRRADCSVSPGLSVSVAELNRLRREALSGLEKARAEKAPISFEESSIPAIPAHRAGLMKLRARFRTAELPEAAKCCELVYVPVTAGAKCFSGLLEKGFPAAAELPRGLFGLEGRLKGILQEVKSAGVRDVWAGNLDSVRLALDAGFRVHGGFSLNITNTQALEWYHSLGLADTELSFELKLSQVAHIGGLMPRGAIVYGRLPLMLCRNCPASNSLHGCLHCKTPPELTDRRGIRFPIQCFGACSEVLNSVPLYLADRIGDGKNLDFGLLRFSTESPREVENILRQYSTALKGAPRSASGNFFHTGALLPGIPVRCIRLINTLEENMNTAGTVEIKIRRVRKGAVLPTRGSAGVAGLDLYACLEKPVALSPGGLYRIPTGIAVALPNRNTVGLIFARSGLGVKHGIAPSNAVGVIDSDYRGELVVGLCNNGQEAYTLSPGERFAQLVVMPVFHTELTETDDLGETERGAGGFGSTGR